VVFEADLTVRGARFFFCVVFCRSLCRIFRRPEV